MVCGGFVSITIRAKVYIKNKGRKKVEEVLYGSQLRETHGNSKGEIDGK